MLMAAGYMLGMAAQAAACYTAAALLTPYALLRYAWMQATHHTDPLR